MPPALTSFTWPISVTKDEPLKRELEDFIEAVRLRRAPGVGGEDGLRALVLATRVAEAVEAGGSGRSSRS